MEDHDYLDQRTTDTLKWFEQHDVTRVGLKIIITNSKAHGAGRNDSE